MNDYFAKIWRESDPPLVKGAPPITLEPDVPAAARITARQLILALTGIAALLIGIASLVHGAPARTYPGNVIAGVLLALILWIHIAVIIRHRWKGQQP